MAMRATLTDVINKLKEKGTGIAVGTLGLIGEKMVYENVAGWHKTVGGTLKQAHEGLLSTIIGVVGMMTGWIPGADDAMTIGLAKMLDGAYDAFISKKPFCYAVDASNIQCFNLDANATVSVKIDGTAVTFTTAPTTDANGNVKITLPTAMSSGKHDIVVSTTKKAFYGIVVV